MSSKSLEKNDLENVLGLSCIENYLLAALNKELPDYEWLYYQSYLPFNKVFVEIVEKYKPYAYFDIIPRIQHTANLNNIIEYRWLKSPFSLIDSEYCCIRIKPDYLLNRYGRKNWRDDHYFLIYEKAGSFYFINDNPRDASKINADELINAYDNEIIYFKLKKTITEEQKNIWKFLFIKQVKNEHFLELNINELYKIDIVQIRDFIGILRIIRKRTDQFINKIITFDMHDYINNLNIIYAQIEYMRLKKRVDMDAIIKQIKALYKTDIEITKSIMKRMYRI